MDPSSVVQPSITPGLRLKALDQFVTYPNRPRTRSYISRTGPFASAAATVSMKAPSVSSPSSPQAHRDADEAHQCEAGLDHHGAPVEPWLGSPPNPAIAHVGGSGS